MPDFSGASLQLKALGEDKVLATLDRVDKKGREVVDGFARLTQSELDKAGEAYDRLYAKQSKSARQTQAVVEDVAQKVNTSLTHTTAIGLGELARGFGRVAESGNLSAFAVREFSGAAFRLGGALGTAGLGAGVGIAAVAIGGLVEYLSSAKRKADELADGYQKDLEKIAHASSLLQASQEEQLAFSGDPFAEIAGKRRDESDVAFMGRAHGLQRLGEESKRLNAEIDKLAKTPLFNAGEGGGRNIALEQLENRLKEVNEQVGILGQRWSIADGARRRLNATEEEAAKIALDKRNEKFDERSVAEYQNDELNRIVQRIKSSGDLTVALTNEHNDVVALRNEQQLLRYELDRDNVSVKERIEKEKELARVTKELAEASGTNIFMGGMNVKVAPKAAVLPDETEQINAIKASGKKMEQEAQRLSNEIGRTLARGITEGIKTWFSGGGFTGGFKAMTAAILDGLGQMFAEVAEKALIGSVIMQKVIMAIQSMNPWVAAVAAGALLAFGNSLRNSGGSGSGGGGYGASGSGNLPGITNTGVVTAASPNTVVTNPASIQSRSMQQNTFYVIGPDDPRAGRQIQQLLNNNARRG